MKDSRYSIYDELAIKIFNNAFITTSEWHNNFFNKCKEKEIEMDQSKEQTRLTQIRKVEPFFLSVEKEDACEIQDRTIRHVAIHKSLQNLMKTVFKLKKFAKSISSNEMLEERNEITKDTQPPSLKQILEMTPQTIYEACNIIDETIDEMKKALF